MHALTVFLLVGSALAALLLWQALARSRRAEYIRTATLPKGLYDKLQKRRPALTTRDCQLVAQALRQFFLAYLKGGRRHVAMPSQVADELWHEFILHTRAYEQFCRHAFGRFMHHTPAVALGSAKRSNEGLRRCWWFACRSDNINPRSPTRLPLLFAIDTKLGIEGGFHYVPDCGPLKGEVAPGSTVVHCGGDFGDAGFDGGTDGFGDGGSSSSDGSSSDGGGDGSSCGGGCSSD